MILSEQEITDVILHNPNRKLVEAGVKANTKLRMHLYGVGLTDALARIDSFEKETMHKLRIKYSKSNKDLFSRLGRPIDKVFSAKGGSIYYNLPDELEARAREMAQNVRNGFSVRQWIDKYWRPHFLDDPFGMMFLEIMPMQEAMLAKQEGRSVVYATYKSITSVYDYQPAGSSLEYVAFKVSNAEKKAAGLDEKEIIYRLIDDANDYYVRRESNDTVTILEQHTFPNLFGYVPAQLNSDIVSAEDENHYLSLYDDVIELAEHFLIKGSIRLTHDFLHGFPKYWELADDCTTCGGAQFVDGIECASCKGSGKQIMIRPADSKLLKYPTKDEPSPAPHVGGYIQPSEIYFNISTSDISTLEEVMHITLWGSSSPIKTKGIAAAPKEDAKKETATGEMLDAKPEADRVKGISEMAEKRHKFFLDNIVRINLMPKHKGTNVQYGSRYLYETPDQVWKKYSAARLEGAASSVLDGLLKQYLETEYESDPVQLEIQEKLMQVEPFIHLTAKECDEAVSITPADKAAKRYFSEWKAQQNEAMFLSMSADLLRDQLKAFAETKQADIDAEKDKERAHEMDLKKQNKPAFGA
jgi:hypothetical protein